MKQEIVITFWADEKHSLDDLLDITEQGEDLFGYDGNECGPESVHIFVSSDKLNEIRDWFERTMKLPIARIETIDDYCSLKNVNKKGIFYKEK